MIPGLTSKMSESVVQSASTIDVKTDIVILKGTTPINIINGHFGGSAGFVILISSTGDIQLRPSSTNNIILSSFNILRQETPTLFLFMRRYPGYPDGIWMPSLSF